MSNHTKGEWRRDKWGQVVTGNGKTLILYGVALSGGRMGEDAEIEANTNLVTASADMYEALKYALQEIESLPQWPDEVNNARHAIIEAIKKAQGGDK